MPISKRFLWIILLLAFWPLHGFSQQKERPNILFILADDLGWADVGYEGSTFYETPNIDLLAKEGMVFTNAYAACPVCSPSRAAIMTGKYPARLGLTDYIPGNIAYGPHKDQYLAEQPFKEYLDLKEITLAEALKKQGYITFFCGKWHLGDAKKYWPEHQGFDINIGGNGSGHPASYFSPYHNPQLPDGPPGENLTDRLTDEAIKFIRQNKNGPFLAYVSFYAVHLPLQAKAALIEKYKLKALGLNNTGKQYTLVGSTYQKNYQNNPVYAAMIETMDKDIGRLLRTLDSEGISKNTIVIFTSDNGGMATARRKNIIPTTNFPLRAGKGYLYEGGIREPLIIRYPGIIKPRITNEPVIQTDLYPTILDLAGLSLLPHQHCDGITLRPLLDGESLKQRDFFWYYPHYSGGLGGRPSAAIREGNFKFIEFFEDGHTELYDLSKDIEEKNDLSATYLSKRAMLKKKLDNWMGEMKVKPLLPNPDYTGK